MLGSWKYAVIIAVVLLAGISGCSTVPKETVELSNTVGRDLEEVHRAHHALAELYFGQLVDKVNRFVDETYRPAFIAKFADEFKLDEKVAKILREAPEKLQPMMTRFTTIATERVDKKRKELLEPIEVQRREVLESIDVAYRQIQAAQAIIAGHLASVRKVHDAQSEMLSKLGLEDVRERIAAKTSSVSDAVQGFVSKGKEIDTSVGVAKDKIEKLDEAIAAAKEKLSQLGI